MAGYIICHAVIYRQSCEGSLIIIMGLLNLSSVCVSLILSSIIIQHADSTPIFGEPLSSIALSGAAGLVFTGASGATLASIPAVTLLAGKALLIKKLLLKKGKQER